MGGRKGREEVMREGKVGWWGCGRGGRGREMGNGKGWENAGVDGGRS